MTLWRHTFEGYAVGVQPAVSTSGGLNGDPFTLVSWSGAPSTVVDSPVAQGIRALRVTTAATPGSGWAEVTGTTSRFHDVSLFVYLLAMPSVEFTAVSLRSSTAALISFNISATGQLKFSGGGTGATSPALALNTWYRWDIRTRQAATPTTSNGTVGFQVTRLSDGVLFHDYSQTDANLNTTNPDRVRMFKTGGTGSADLVFDTPSYRYAEDVAGYIAPLSDFVPPVLTYEVLTNTSVRLDLTAVPTATAYSIQRAPDASGSPGTWATIYTGSARTYTDTGRTPGTSYWYRPEASK